MKPKWMGKNAKKRLRYSNRESVRQWRRNSENFDLACTEKKNGREGHVYIFKLQDGLYKIGRTYNIEKRLRAFRTSNPDIKCIWSAWSKDCYELEKKIHVSMKHYHYDREIFTIPEGEIKNINEIAIRFNEQYQ